MCDIIIDECVTISYHRSGLEGLALGKQTICSLNPAVASVLQKVSGSSTVPFDNVGIAGLEGFLISLINKGIDAVQNKGRQCKQWFEKNWSPQQIVKEFGDLYLNDMGGINA